MCSLIILRRPHHDWPLILAFNRDEKIDRPSLPPGRHWAEREKVIAGKDQIAGGTWLGLNDFGLVAGVLNRKKSLGPNQQYRSRGELPLEALDHAEAKIVAKYFFDLNPLAYQPFNFFVADNNDAFWISSVMKGKQEIKIKKIPTGTSMLTDSDLNDHTCKRINYNLPRFAKATPPNPDKKDWSAWQNLLKEGCYEINDHIDEVMTIPINNNFGTVSSSLIAIPSTRFPSIKPYWFFSKWDFSKPFEQISI